MTLDANRTLIRNFHQAIMVERNLEQVAQFMRDPLIDHDETGEPETLEHVKQSFEAFFKAFPDLQYKLDVVMAEDDLVSCMMTLSGTQQGEFMGAPPSQKAFTVTAMAFFRIADGQIIERWDWVDRMALRTQLGIQN